MENKNTKNKIGALWLKKSKNATNYLSGTITLPDGIQRNIVVFKNTYKSEQKHPDYRIFLDERPEKNDVPADTANNEQTVVNKKAGENSFEPKNATPTSVHVTETVEAIEDEDIPF